MKVHSFGRREVKEFQAICFNEIRTRNQSSAKHEPTTVPKMMFKNLEEEEAKYN